MTPKCYLATVAVVAATTGFAIPGVAAASDNDTREISSYVLTEGGLAKFTQAAQKLYDVPGACAQGDYEGADSQSIDQMVAKLNAVPGAQSAIRSAGLTTREYIVFMWSMVQNGMAAWAVSQPGGKLPPGVSQANVDFYKKHEARFAAIGENDPCDDDAGEEEESEE